MASGEGGVGGVRGLEKAAKPGEPSLCAAMETRQLIVWGFAVACLRLGAARFLRVVVPTYWDDEDDMRPVLLEDAAAGAVLEREGQAQGNRVHPAVENLPRKFPDGQAVVLERPTAPLHHQQQSVKTDRLAVRCSERKIQVEVKQDLMGRGRLVSPEELTLGGCPPTEVDSWAHVMAFESELHGCGSVLAVRRPPRAACVWPPQKLTRLFLPPVDEGAHVHLHLLAHLQTQKERRHAHHPEPGRPHPGGVPLPQVTPPAPEQTGPSVTESWNQGPPFDPSCLDARHFCEFRRN